MDSISNLFKWKKKNKDDDDSSSNSDNENTTTTKRRNKMQKDVYDNGEIVKALWKGGKNKKFKFWYEATVVKRNKDGTYKLNYSDGSKDSRVHPKYICPTDSIPRRKNEIGHPTDSYPRRKNEIGHPSIRKKENGDSMSNSTSRKIVNKTTKLPADDIKLPSTLPSITKQLSDEGKQILLRALSSEEEFEEDGKKRMNSGEEEGMKMMDGDKDNKFVPPPPPLPAQKDRNGITLKPPGHPDATPIFKWLLIGGIFDSQNRRLLRQHNVKSIINITPTTYKRPRNLRNFASVSIDDNVGTDIYDYFKEVSKYIDRYRNAGGALLIHCEYGISRSVTFVMAYLMKYRKMGILKALNTIRSCRPLAMAQANPDFIEALLKWDKWERNPKNKTKLTVNRIINIIENGEDDDNNNNIKKKAPAKKMEYKELDDFVVKHKNFVAEHILTLHCPECGQAFLDFTNCFALWCSRCNCAFCAYCQQSCRRERNDAHRHVSNCKYNIAPGKSIFASRKIWEYSQNLRRCRHVKEYLSTTEDLAGNIKMQLSVLSGIKQDLTDLGMEVEVDEKNFLYSIAVPKMRIPKYGSSSSIFSSRYSRRGGGGGGGYGGSSWGGYSSRSNYGGNSDDYSLYSSRSSRSRNRFRYDDDDDYY